VSKLIYDKQGRVVRMTLNRPEARNALDDELNRQLADAWQAFQADTDAEVAILAGTGANFCAGADLKSFIPKWSNMTLGAARDALRQGLGGGLTRGRHRLGKPVIAAIEGYAVGGGLELALACDIRVASDEAKFGVFEVRQGIHQGDGGLVRLLAIAGLGTAMDLTLTGREVDAGEALQLGLVSRVVPRGELVSTAQSYAEMILGNGQRAVRSAKETLLDIVGRTLDDALRIEAFNGYSGPGDYAEVKARSARFARREA
jgi:enoyl-CoA hydratase/carnithine racemase